MRRRSVRVAATLVITGLCTAYIIWKIDVGETIIVNCPTEVYHYNDPDEYRMDPHLSDIPYDWDRRDY